MNIQQEQALEPSMLTESTRSKLKQVGTPNIANVLLKRGFRNVMMHNVQPLASGQEQLVGPAYTLRFIPAREDLDSMANYAKASNKHRRAIEECPPDSVLVIDAFGNLEASAMGDMMAARLKYRGVAGVVTDGGYRDSASIIATGLPCFQRRSAASATPIKLHPLELNEPIGCGGVAVYPGDIIVGDTDGVVVIPVDLVDEVADEALHSVQFEEFAEQHIKSGRSIMGLFPETPESRKEYDAWVAAGRPQIRGEQEA